MLFLGEASNFRGRVAHHLFATGTQRDSERLISYLASRYSAPSENIVLTTTGRSALALALKSLVPKGSAVVISGFTCHAVLVALRAAGCTPVFADIEESSLNYTPDTLEKLLKSDKNIRAFILQNTLGNPVDVRPFEKLARAHNLVLIEDMAHCAGRLYPDGREIGTVGDAACFSFGKGKSIDTITGGAVLLRKNPENPKNAQKPLSTPNNPPKLSSSLRARFYPFFGTLLRASFHLGLNRYLAGALLRLHWIERSADAPLDLSRRLSHWQARLALEEFQKLSPTSRPLRTFDLVDDRPALLQKLRRAGYVFDEFWYEVPISPARYYSRSGFDETACPVATSVSRRIINLPTHYPDSALAPARKIITEHKKQSTHKEQNA